MDLMPQCLEAKMLGINVNKIEQTIGPDLLSIGRYMPTFVTTASAVGYN